MPLSTSFGRRPVYLASTLVCLASSIWRAKATTYGSFMGACVLNGLGAGPAEVRQHNGLLGALLTKTTFRPSSPPSSLISCSCTIEGNTTRYTLLSTSVLWLYAWFFHSLPKFKADRFLGGPYHRWCNGTILYLAELLVAQRCHAWNCISDASLWLSRNEMAPSASR